MSRDERVAIRLECMKLACSRGQTFGDVFAVAKSYEEYILSADTEVKPKQSPEPKGSDKKSGNAAILA
jgi:hypothetical protein